MIARPDALEARGAAVAVLVAVAIVSGTASASAQIVRSDHFVAGETGITLHVREVQTLKRERSGPPLLLLHGARVPGVASFDLDVPGGSFAADLAAAGHTVFAMDARGYGESTRPAAMAGPRDGAPLVRSTEVVRDIEAVVDWIARRTGVERVALFGWATGGHWLGFYATLHPERVSHLVLYNTLYGGSADHPSLGHGSNLEDPSRPGRFNQSAYGRYRLNTEASLFPSWDDSIPGDDKTAWRDPAIAHAYAGAALASDETSGTRRPASFRAPSGAMEDSFYLATGRRLWDASLITSPTLVVASERDFWSRPADRLALERDLVHASRVRVVVLPDATHFAHLERPERGRARLIDELQRFLGGSND